ncbi:MAG: SDR family NAD(P)-dependent oxidoreductase, partial [Pseudomonadota bacterium]
MRKILILTGASRGIGHATVKRFSADDWRVITCSRNAFDSRCPWPGGEDNHIQVDLANPADIERAVVVMKQKIAEDGGALHALVNNAGISPKNENGERLDSSHTPMDVWSQVFQVNFFAPIMLARGLFEELKCAPGAIVNVTSIVGRARRAFQFLEQTARKHDRSEKVHLKNLRPDIHRRMTGIEP